MVIFNASMLYSLQQVLLHFILHYKSATKPARYEQQTTYLHSQQPIAAQVILHDLTKEQGSNDLRQYDKEVEDTHVDTDLIFGQMTASIE